MIYMIYHISLQPPGGVQDLRGMVKEQDTAPVESSELKEYKSFKEYNQKNLTPSKMFFKE